MLQIKVINLHLIFVKGLKQTQHDFSQLNRNHFLATV